MDLKDVVQSVQHSALEASNAFHAGHHDNAEKYLYEIEKLVVEYLRMPSLRDGDVTGSATSETPTETLQETQAKVSGPGVQPAVIDPDTPDSKALPATQFVKPTQ